MYNQVTVPNAQHIMAYVEKSIIPGINSASKVFQNEKYMILQGLNSVINLSGAILLHGNNKG